MTHSRYDPEADAAYFYLTDGQIIPTEGLRRDGATILASIKTKEGTQGESGYALTNIARIDFPEPAQLKLARNLLNAGKTDEAVRQLTPILAYYEPFHDVPGNWWTPLALLQVDAFARLGRDNEVDALLGQIARFGSADADTQREVRIKQAVSIERRGDHRKALDELEPIVNDVSISPETLSEAWLAVGSAHLGLRDYQEAELAFLHVPVYTPDQVLLMPPALLGSASAFVGLGDGQRAQTALKQLIASYPNSPEAAEAKTRLQKFPVTAHKPAGS